MDKKRRAITIKKEITITTEGTTVEEGITKDIIIIMDKKGVINIVENNKMEIANHIRKSKRTIVIIDEIIDKTKLLNLSNIFITFIQILLLFFLRIK
jgi:hypothetical protein